MKIQPSQLNESIRKIPLPDLMAERPVSKRGFPVPFFASLIDGEWDFRVINPQSWKACVQQKLCWVCGQRMGGKLAFCVGPMCVVTWTSAEPPSHYSCAQYSALACPFLAAPAMRRNEKNLPEEVQQPSGHALMRNPGVAAVLVTRKMRIFKDQNGGPLVEMGQPENVEWYARRGRATRKEIMDSIESGLPELMRLADNGKDREDEHKELGRRLSLAMRWLPEDGTAPALADLAKNMKRNPWGVTPSGGDAAE